ncbi:MAG: hypothetical protein L3J57_08105, partial [Desulfuromusa sp.]|nr:hypothetical protein [Desulfuromusa sp.]
RLHRETYRETDLDSWIYLLVELLSITTMSDYVTSTFVWWIEPINYSLTDEARVKLFIFKVQ